MEISIFEWIDLFKPHDDVPYGHIPIITLGTAMAAARRIMKLSLGCGC